MTSRRSILTGLGTVGVASLAGCSSLPFGDEPEDGRTDVTLSADAIDPIPWPESPLPVAIPSTLADAHRDRADELLAAVPIDPSLPNGAVAEELRADRERTAGRLEEAVEEPWPTEALSRWRSRRNDAATVRGSYRAAAGEDDAATIDERRHAVRGDLGSFIADYEYRASTPLEAVLVHAPIEGLIANSRRRVRPDPAYPADPIAHPFRAGEAVGRVEFAHATLADARQLREVYLTERADVSAQWATLIEISDRLRVAVDVTRQSVRNVLDLDEPPFDADLEGTAGRALFRQASRRSASVIEDHQESHDDGDYATAVIEAGRALAAIETLRTVSEEIRDDNYQDAVTVKSVAQTAERARESIVTVEELEGGRLSSLLLRPVFETFDSFPHRIEAGYVDATRVQGELAWADLYARAVPAASEFVVDRIDGSSKRA